jgi:hypothetical protein
MRLAGNVACVGKKRGEYRDLVVRPGGSRLILEEDNKMDLEEALTE